MIERWCACTVDSPRFLADGDHAGPRHFSRSEVDVGELGERVAHLVVDGALAHFAAFDVGYGNAHGQRGGSGSQHLVSVCDEQKEIGPPCRERIGQAENRETDCLGHAGIGVGTEQAFDARADGKTIGLNLMDRRTELGRKVRSQGEDSQFDLGVRGQFAQRPIEMAVVGARSRHHADATIDLGLRHGGKAS
jgi:hypothetical protein